MAASEGDIRFKESLLKALQCLNLETLTLRKEQENAIKNAVVRKKDVLVVLPTGFGKSLIFQLLPFVFDSWLITNDSFILIVSPLNALMRDQIIKLESLKVETLIIRCGEAVSDADIQGITQAKFRIIYNYGHPEAFLEKLLRKVLDSDQVRQKMRAIVVDEAHLVEEWKNFRPAYAQLSMLSALFPKVPIVALTATATERTRCAISSSLGMTDPVTITVNPNRSNIFYTAARRQHSGDDKIEVLLLPYIAKLKDMREQMPLTVFYSNLQICGECFSIFDHHLGVEQYTPKGALKLAKNRLFAQFHATYPEKEKNDIIDDLIKGPGKIRVLFVTVAFGIGVDCPHIREVVHIGVPSTMEEFFQESGRVGRDGKPAISRVFFNSYDISKGKEHLQQTMRNFVLTSGCRRKIILQYFGFSIPVSKGESTLHLCCDNCSATCCCDDCQSKAGLDTTMNQLAVIS